jgi:protein SCO1/2
VSTKALIIVGLVTFVLLNASLMGLYLLSGAGLAPGSSDALPVIATLPDFSLTSDKGTAIDNKSLAGKVWIADFIFTSCSGPCPVMTRSMAAVAKKLELHPEVNFVSISVDPETDTPEVLARYGEKFGANPERWHFLTGTVESIQQLAVKGFMIGSVDDPVIHSTKFCLVDQKGQIRGYFTGTDEVETDQLIAAALRLLEE